MLWDKDQHQQVRKAGDKNLIKEDFGVLYCAFFY